MHEISLVRNIFNTLEAEFPGRLSTLRNIHLTVGILSNVQPLLMQSAFEAVLQDEPQYAGTELHVDVLPIIIECPVCSTKSEVDEYKFICKQCGRPTNNVVQGDELLISRVEFADT